MANIEHYKHKYLCVYNTQGDYDTDKDNFEEANYSLISPVSSTDSVYYPSERETNNDNKYVMKYNSNDNLVTVAFIESIWGYFGWEWNDYVLNDVTYKGGNLFKSHDTENVRTVPDGKRLQHINDFLNSQDKINNVELFDVSNILYANRAFLRLSSQNVCTLSGGTSTQNVHFFKDLKLAISDWPALINADYMFANNNLSDISLSFPKLVSCKGMFMGGAMYNNVTIKAPLAESLERIFCFASFDKAEVNLNDYFVGEFPNVTNISYMCTCATFVGDDDANVTISFDLSNFGNSDNTIDASALFYGIDNTNQRQTINKKGNLIIKLNYNKPIILDNAFRLILRPTYEYVAFTNVYEDEKPVYARTGRKFETMDISDVFTEDKLKYISSISHGLLQNNFTTCPLKQRPNDNCDDSYIYNSCSFTDIVYDFSPNKVVVDSTSQFANCTADTIDFKNVEYLKYADFSKLTLSTPAEFPCLINHNGEEIYGDNGKYQIFNFNGSNITGIKDKNLYYTPCDIVDGIADCYDVQIAPFANCPNIDFDNVNLYIANLGNTTSGTGYVVINFTGCTAMTHSPIIHFKITKIKQYYPLAFYCNKLTNLVEFDAEDTDCEVYDYPYSVYTTFANDENLVYLKLGKVYIYNLDLVGCKKLDVDTLLTTITTLRAVGGSGVVIESEVWNKFTDEQKATAIASKTINIIER